MALEGQAAEEAAWRAEEEERVDSRPLGLGSRVMRERLSSGAAPGIIHEVLPARQGKPVATAMTLGSASYCKRPGGPESRLCKNVGDLVNLFRKPLHLKIQFLLHDVHVDY